MADWVEEGRLTADGRSLEYRCHGPAPAQAPPVPRVGRRPRATTPRPTRPLDEWVDPFADPLTDPLGDPSAAPPADPGVPHAALDFSADPAPRAPETGPRPAAPRVPDPAGRAYTVQVGDTLSGIAERELGDHRRYFDIYAANRDRLVDPDALKVGMVLRLPE